MRVGISYIDTNEIRSENIQGILIGINTCISMARNNLKTLDVKSIPSGFYQVSFEKLVVEALATEIERYYKNTPSEMHNISGSKLLIKYFQNIRFGDYTICEIHTEKFFPFLSFKFYPVYKRKTTDLFHNLIFGVDVGR